jgi:RNA polymerase sigma-70 factor, ECF subfamily
LAIQQKSLTAQQIQEEYLLVRAAQKNPRRFSALYERYYRQIYLFVYKRVDDEENTADVASQVFLKAMLNLEKYQFKGVPFSAWLYRIAINEVNQFFRETRNQRTVSIDSESLPMLMEEVAEPSNEAAIQRMLVVMQSLSPEEVQLVELRYFEKMPFREVAEIYNITENNAKVRLYRILEKMKKLMTQNVQL